MLMTSVLLVALGLFQPNPLLHSSSTKAAAPVQPATAQAPIAGSGSAAPTTVDVKSLPPVTVNPARKDWADWGYWAFGGLLVIVGIFQVALLYRTVTIGQKQRDLLEPADEAGRAPSKSDGTSGEFNGERGHFP